MKPFLVPHFCGFFLPIINSYTLYFCRATEGRLLPLRPPPVKLSKSERCPLTPATTNQHSGYRGVKRGPPLPPRPKPGHPLYRDYTVRPVFKKLKMAVQGFCNLTYVFKCRLSSLWDCTRCDQSHAELRCIISMHSSGLMKCVCVCFAEQNPSRKH